MTSAEPETAHEADPPGIDVAALGSWLEANVAGAEGPFRFTFLAGGRSNLTYRVDDAGGHTWVVRRPPVGHVLATAHDMGREHRIIAALGPTDVPVPHALALCDDTAVLGAPFYVMDFVPGIVVRNSEGALAISPELRARAGLSLVDVLARIHAVDPDAVGLGQLARREGYIARQLKRWHAQWESSGNRDVPEIHETHDLLMATIPEQGPASLVHGDYKLDNCLLAPTGDVLAVVDWELCTLGDPLADLGLLLVYWGGTEDDVTALSDPPTVVDGFPTRDEVVAAYATASGRDLSRLDFYVAYGWWKMACILEGVNARYRGGSGADAEHQISDDRVDALARTARSAVARLG